MVTFTDEEVTEIEDMTDEEIQNKIVDVSKQYKKDSWVWGIIIFLISIPITFLCLDAVIGSYIVGYSTYLPGIFPNIEDIESFREIMIGIGFVVVILIMIPYIKIVNASKKNFDKSKFYFNIKNNSYKYINSLNKLKESDLIFILDEMKDVLDNRSIPKNEIKIGNFDKSEFYNYFINLSNENSSNIFNEVRTILEDLRNEKRKYGASYERAY